MFNARRLVEAERKHLTKRKDVHVSLAWDEYVRARGKLFEYNLTLTECFEEFALLLAHEHPLGKKIIDRCYRNAMQRKLDELKEPKKALSFDKIDVDAVYDMINDEQGEDEHDEE